MTQDRLATPILLYDGSCRFCEAGVARWRNQSIVEVLPVQGGGGASFGLPPDKPMGALHLIESSGEMWRGAAAVFRMMDLCGDFPGALLWKLYRSVGLFRTLTDWGYGLVAARRAKLSALCGSGYCSVAEPNDL
jgi:predicted DCC family thiol-disulfide oxidoreductase YuxK